MIQDESDCQNSLDGASKGIQGSPKLTQQLVQTSQATNSSEQAPTLTKLPFSLAISPKEFCMLKAAYHSVATRRDRAIRLKVLYTAFCLKCEKDKLIQDESQHYKRGTIYRFIIINHEFSGSALSALARK